MDRQRVISSLLAEYGGAAAAYSLRALNGNGDSVVRVRRASDNDEKDFTAEQIKLGEMVNWVTEESATADAFVTTWYDQSGNGRNATQATTTRQPQIVSAGSLVTLNGKPTLDWGIVQARGFTLASPLSYSYANFVYKVSAVNTVNYLLGGEPNILALAGTANASFDGLTLSDATIQALGNAEDTNAHLGVYYNDGANNFLAVDGNTASSVGAFTSALSFDVIGNSTFTSTGSLNGLCSEIILYPSNQSATRTAIEDNINAHYNIYP